MSVTESRHLQLLIIFLRDENLMKTQKEDTVDLYKKD